jgi:hypothetical protein
MCYIVVVFIDGIGHTYQMNGKCDWNFTALPRYFTKLGSAKQRAHKLFNNTICNKVIVYKVDSQEILSTSFYKMWNEHKREKIVYELKKEEK